MAPWSQSKSMQGQGSNPDLLPPTTSPSPKYNAKGSASSAMSRRLPAHAFLQKHPLGFLRNRGCWQGHGGPTCSGRNKHEVTRSRGEIFIHSGRAW